MNQQSFFIKLFERRIGTFCTILFLCSLLFIFCPIVPLPAQAADCQPGDPAPCATAYADQQVDVNVASTVSIALQNSLAIDVVPKAGGSFTSNATALTVATNNPTGYSMYMQATKSTNGAATLTSTDLGNTAVINPVTGKVTANSFTNNTWGYSLDGTTYQAVPANTTVIHETDSTTFQDQYSLSFGVAIDTNLPAGQYNNSVTISAVANPITLTSLNQLNYMQEMTTSICETTALNTTKQLIDQRDGKKYWVAKLADNNCWMTQNLALDLVKGKVYTPADTDIASNWTVPTTTETAIPTALGSNAPQNEARSWNLGQYVIATPQKGEPCAYQNPNGTTPTDGTDSVWTGQNLSQCSDFQDVTGWSPTLTTHNGSWPKSNYTGMVAADPVSEQYDPHYLIGNYYQWNAATAGTGATTDSTNTNSSLTSINALVDATSSICPKGWQLPSSGRYYSSTSGIAYPYSRAKSFAKLIAAYGYPTPGPAQASDWSISSGSTLPHINFETTTDRLDGAPVYYTRVGFINLSYGTLRATGGNAWLWSSTANQGSTTYAYQMSISNNKTYPAYPYNRYRGDVIRCVAR